MQLLNMEIINLLRSLNKLQLPTDRPTDRRKKEGRENKKNDTKPLTTLRVTSNPNS
jgi:hypothetical protein